jgi:hypothetical protein
MKRAIDIPALVGGVAVTVLGVLMLLDRAHVLHLGFGWLWPLLLATAGTYLVASGVAGTRR